MGSLVICRTAPALPVYSGTDMARPFLGDALSTSGGHAAFSHSDPLGRGSASYRPGRQSPARPVFLLYVVLVPAAGALGAMGESKEERTSECGVMIVRKTWQLKTCRH